MPFSGVQIDGICETVQSASHRNSTCPQLPPVQPLSRCGAAQSAAFASQSLLMTAAVLTTAASPPAFDASPLSTLRPDSPSSPPTPVKSAPDPPKRKLAIREWGSTAANRFSPPLKVSAAANSPSRSATPLRSGQLPRVPVGQMLAAPICLRPDHVQTVAAWMIITALLSL